MLACLLLTAQKPALPMTIESIMRGEALIGHAPRSLQWSADGKQLRFSWAKADGTPNPRYREYVVNADGIGLTQGSSTIAATPTNPADRGSRVGDKSVYESQGDLYLYDYSAKTTKQITTTPEYETMPRLSADGKSVTYLVSNNAWRLTLADGSKTQVSELASSDKPDGSAGLAIHIPEGFLNGLVSLSPTGTHETVELDQFAKDVRVADVPNYITGSGYPELIQTYPRVGAPQTHSKAMIVDLSTGASVEMAGARASRITAIRWSSDGVHAIAVARSEDHKDDWILGFDAKTDKVSMLWDEHCDAWVGGPGRGTLGWLPDGSRFYFESEKNGYANLYSMAAGGGAPQPLVIGDFEVSDVRLDTKLNRFTFVSSEGSPFKRHLDAINFDGSGKKKLADLSADEDMTYAIAPNGTDVAVVRSKSNRPGELYVGNKQVTNTPTDEFLKGPWIDPPIVMVPSTDGVKVPSRVFKPKNWKPGGPAVIFVHGAGYLQNVYDGWSHYFREYLFHHFLMEHGYMVLDMDFRASAGYGRDWRTAIYRHMGGKDLDDQVAGASWLVSQGAAKDRIGIYGGSYGGFLTLMAMFTKPGVFAAGAALRPVSDWASYNHPYTSEILNNPQDDKEAYKQSSPINFVAGLKGALLICHGMVDTNVTFQDSVRLTEKLIELGKTNWDIAPYPVEDHTFTRPSSWTDEYRRIFELFEHSIGSRRPKL